MTIKYLSICSGIEAASAAWKPLGWKAVGFAEIEAFPSAVLAHHYPDVPNFGDMTKHEGWNINEPVDLVCGGTPCQGFSVAGLRGGMDDARSRLAHTFVEIAARNRPKWLVWENVPGVFSSAGGADFGGFLGALTGRVLPTPADGWPNSGVVEGIPDAYSVAWRVLDAQYFGVPQRRNRVFVVGCLGDWRRASAVLFERESLCGHPAPCREKGEGFTHDVSPCVGASGRGFERGGETRGQDPVVACAAVAGTLRSGATSPAAHGNATDHAHALDCLREAQIVALPVTGTDGGGEFQGLEVAHSLRGEGFDASEDGTGRGTPLVAMVNMQGSKGNAVAQADGPSFTLNAMHGHDVHAVAVPEIGNRKSEIGNSSMQVRRLTPVECESLQGFPPNYTAIPWRKKPAEECPDGPRYKALGNSMAVPVMRWIGERIELVEAMKSTNQAEDVI